MTEHPIYAKVNLQETNYTPSKKIDYKLLPKDTDPEPLLEIYFSINRMFCHLSIISSLYSFVKFL